MVLEITACRESLPTIRLVWGNLLSGSSMLFPFLPLPWLLLPHGICFLVFASWYLAYRKASEAADQAFDLLQFTLMLSLGTPLPVALRGNLLGSVLSQTSLAG
ncbi:hypothetical protein Tco_0306569, partial [Tanacetum coccineum]